MTGWRGTVVVAVSAAVLAATATWLVAFQPTRNVGDDPTLAQYPLERVSFVDTQPTTVTLHPGEARAVTTPRAGVVTKATCKPGADLATGSILVQINQRPVIVISTAAPLFRDLRGGERGADVTALQAELRALGYAAPSSKVYDAATKRAVYAFLSARGISQTPAERGILSMRDIAWVSPGDLTIERCLAVQGDRLGAGDSVLHLIGSPGQVEYTETGAADGARQLVIGSTRIDVTGSPIDGSEEVRAILQTPQGQAAGQREGKTFGATLELASPIDAYPVPPSALFAITGNTACVSDRGEAFTVTIVASSLGMSYITFAGSPPPAVDVFPVRSGSCG